MNDSDWQVVQDHWNSAVHCAQGSAEMGAHMLAAMEEVVRLAEARDGGRLGIRGDRALRLIVRERAMQKACHHAVREAYSDFLERLRAQLRPEAALSDWFADVKEGRQLPVIRCFADCAAAALAARGRDHRSMVNSLQAAAEALRNKPVDPPLESDMTARHIPAQSADDEVQWVVDACMVLHGRLDQDGWIAMAVLDLALDMLEQPRTVLGAQPD